MDAPDSCPDSAATSISDPVSAFVTQAPDGAPAEDGAASAFQPVNLEQEFAAIEGAVAATARGRWFLEEYARRVRARDVAPMVAALERVERRLAEGADLDAVASAQENARGPNALSTLAGLRAALRLPDDFAARLNAKRAALARRPLAPSPEFIRKRMEMIEQSSRAPGRALPAAESEQAASELETALQQIASAAAEAARAKQAAAAASPEADQNVAQDAGQNVAQDAEQNVAQDVAQDPAQDVPLDGAAGALSPEGALAASAEPEPDAPLDAVAPR